MSYVWQTETQTDTTENSSTLAVWVVNIYAWCLISTFLDVADVWFIKYCMRKITSVSSAIQSILCFHSWHFGTLMSKIRFCYVNQTLCRIQNSIHLYLESITVLFQVMNVSVYNLGLRNIAIMSYIWKFCSQTPSITRADMFVCFFSRLFDSPIKKLLLVASEMWSLRDRCN